MVSDTEEGDDTILYETEIELAVTTEVTANTGNPPPKKSKLDSITDFVVQTKANQKLNQDQVLPDPRSIRRAHH